MATTNQNRQRKNARIAKSQKRPQKNPSQAAMFQTLGPFI